MTILDENASAKQYDAPVWLAQLAGLPDLLESTWASAQLLPLVEMKPQRIVIAASGEGALAAQMVAAYAAARSIIPVVACEGYDLPHWVRGADTLVICLFSVSLEDAEETTLSALQQAQARGCTVLTIAAHRVLDAPNSPSLGSLWLLQETDLLAWRFNALVLAALHRLMLLPGAVQDLTHGVAALRVQQNSFAAESPVGRNPAKRMAGQLMDRWSLVIAAGPLTAAARYWRSRLNGWPYAMAFADEIPGPDVFMAGGVQDPTGVPECSMILCLHAPSDHVQNRLRLQAMREYYLVSGFNTDALTAVGEGFLSHMWTLCQYADYAAAYLTALQSAALQDPQVFENLAVAVREILSQKRDS